MPVSVRAPNPAAFVNHAITPFLGRHKMRSRPVVKKTMVTITLFFIFLPGWLFLFSDTHASTLNQEKIRIGVLCPLTTPEKDGGISHLQGVTLALNDFGGSIDSLEIELLIADDRGNGKAGVEEVKKLINSGVVAVLGPCNSRVAEKIIQEGLLKSVDRIPIIGSLTTASKLTSQREFPTDYFFRANVGDRKRVEQLVDHIYQEINPGKVAIIYEGYGDTYGVGLKNEFKDLAKIKYSKSGHFEFEYQHNPKPDDIKYIGDALRKHGFSEKDVILLFGIGIDSRNFANVLKNEIVLQSFIYVFGVNHKVFQKAIKAGTNLEGLRIFSAFVSISSEIGKVSRFKSQFEKVFAEEGTSASALAYDATYILLTSLKSALKNVKEMNGTLEISTIREELKTQIANHGISEDQFILNGKHQFQNNEYENLRFSGVHLTYEGKMIPWNSELPAKPPEPFLFSPPIPNLVVILLIYVFSVIGSIVRQYYHFKSLNLKDLNNRKRFIAVTFVFDPLIAGLIFYIIYFILLLNAAELLTTLGDPNNLFYLSGSIIGFLVGVLGINALFLIFEKMGVKNLIAKGQGGENKEAHMSEDAIPQSQNVQNGEVRTLEDPIINIGSTAGEINSRVTQIEEGINILQNHTVKEVGDQQVKDEALRYLKNVKEELWDMKTPDKAHIGMWLEKTAKCINDLNLGGEDSEKVKSIFSAFTLPGLDGQIQR